MTHDSVMPQPSFVTCETFEEQLSAMLDDEVTGAMLAALQAHRASCEVCALLHAELAAIQAEAAALPTLTPSVDLWSGIAERITHPVIQLPAHPQGTARSLSAATQSAGSGAAPWFRRPWLAAAAALLLVASSAGITYRLAVPSSPSGAPPATIAAGPALPVDRAEALRSDSTGAATATPAETAAAVPARGGAAPSAVLAANRPSRSATPDVSGAYASEIDRMRALLDQRQSRLDTGTVRVLETNLAIIDRAIRESRAALARDPASGLLNRQLSDALGEKLELMRTAVELSSGD